MKKYIPEAVYACKNQGCREEQTFPADMLFWSKEGWVCEDCADYEDLETSQSLADFIEQQKADFQDIDKWIENSIENVEKICGEFTFEQYDEIVVILRLAFSNGRKMEREAWDAREKFIEGQILMAQNRWKTHCGHPRSSIISNGTTSYCKDCAKDADVGFEQWLDKEAEPFFTEGGHGMEAEVKRIAREAFTRGRKIEQEDNR